MSNEDEYRMIFIVNNSLKMKKGKIAAQCGHAAIGLYKFNLIHHKNNLKLWERTGGAKIVCKGDNIEHLENIMNQVLLKKIPVFLVEDQGRTQIEPGSKTILGIGPVLRSEIDNITSDLKLL